MARSIKITGPGRLGSTRAVKKSLATKAFLTRQIPAEDSLTVRLLDEPEDFFGYYQHWMADGPIPCIEGDCDGCNSDDPEQRRKSFRYLANAYVVDNQKVEAVELPKSLVEQLVTYYEKYKTLMDRDYDLKKTGSGKNGTKYFASPDSPSRMNTSRFKKLDLGVILQQMALEAQGIEPDDDDDEDDEPVTRKKSSRTSSKGRRKPEPDPWDDDDDEDDDEPPARRVVRKSSASKSSSARRIIRK